MSTCGLVTANLFRTLGEVVMRGGSEAAYTTLSRGGAWAVYPKGAVATAFTPPEASTHLERCQFNPQFPFPVTDSRPPVQPLSCNESMAVDTKLLQPATNSENSENLDRGRSGQCLTGLQGFVQEVVEVHQGETLTPPKKTVTMRCTCGAVIRN